MNSNIYILKYLERNGFQDMITTAQKRRLEEEASPNLEQQKVRFAMQEEKINAKMHENCKNNFKERRRNVPYTDTI